MSEFSEIEQFVDIHGREIPTVSINNEPACFFDCLKQTGVGILKKSQYAKLASVKKDFGPNFVEFMLDSAKNYMLANKVSFSEEQIKNSIEKCKQTLSEPNIVKPSINKDFIQNREIESAPDNKILIKVSTPSSRTPLAVPKRTPITFHKEPETESSSSDADSVVKQRKYPKKGPPTRTSSHNGLFTKQEENAGAPKLRPPKARFSYNTTMNELNVIVTAIDKTNCVWVRDLENNGLFEQVHERANSEAEGQKGAPKPWKRGNVYLAKDEDSWFRCRVIKPNPLIVFFIDYGNCAEVDELREISEDLAKVPPLAMRITFKETGFEIDLEKEIRIKPFTKNDDGTYFVNILGDVKGGNKQIDGEENWGNTQANLQKNKFERNRRETEGNLENPKNNYSGRRKTEGNWGDGRGDSKNMQKQESEESWGNPKNTYTNRRKTEANWGGGGSSKNEDEENWGNSKNSSTNRRKTEEEWGGANPKTQIAPHHPVFFKKPPPLATLENDQKVVIIHEENCSFYLRTKECFTKLKEIEDAITDFAPESQTLKNVQVDQLVLYQNPSERKLFRAIVTKTTESDCEIELLDHVAKLVVNPTKLKSINEKLSKEPVTFFCGEKLEGFEDKPFNEDCRKLIEECIKTRKKFVVTLGFDDMDLFDGTQMLSKELKNLGTPRKPNQIVERSVKSSGKILLKDIKPYKPDIGVKAYVCGYYKSSTELAIVPSDELANHIDYILRSEIDDRRPYVPIIGEVCLCYFVDNWYRCVVLNIFDKDYEVLLVDFGNIELVEKEKLRKPDAQVTEIHALALPCVLVGLPPHHDVEAVLKKLIIEGEIYNVDVKQVSDGKCHVEIPSVYKKICEL